MTLGTSPHARGPLSMGSCTASSVGNIPACAGTTGFVYLIGGFFWEHPRMRGDHRLVGRRGGELMGTSPHARGPRNHLHQIDFCIGNIPACAGTTPSGCRLRSSSREHPRMRGDHILPSSVPRSHVGTSPHARGPQGNTIIATDSYGNIPACAGTTI